MQLALDTAFIEMVTERDLPVFLTLQEFPYPPHTSDTGLTDTFLYVLPFVTIFSFIFNCGVIGTISGEKQSGMRVNANNYDSV